MHNGCNTHFAGVGVWQGSKFHFCCNDELFSLNLCSDIGRLIYNPSILSKADQAREIMIPKTGDVDIFLHNPLLTIPTTQQSSQSSYSLMIANCNTKGRPLHVVGTIAWSPENNDSDNEIDDGGETIVDNNSTDYHDEHDHDGAVQNHDEVIDNHVYATDHTTSPTVAPLPANKNDPDETSSTTSLSGKEGAMEIWPIAVVIIISTAFLVFLYVAGEKNRKESNWQNNTDDDAAFLAKVQDAYESNELNPNGDLELRPTINRNRQRRYRDNPVERDAGANATGLSQII